MALVPFIHAVYSVDKRDSFRIGFFWGLFFFGPVLWWIAPTISTYGKLPLAAAWVIFALLTCYLALFPGLWAWLARLLVAEKGQLSVLGILAVSSLWILVEALRGWLLSGFPWAMLAYSLCRAPFLIQTADLWGPYGIGFIIFFSNMVVWQLYLLSTQRGGIRVRDRAVSLPVFTLVGLLAFLCVYGSKTISEPSNGKIRVAAIQGSFDQSVKWSAEYRIATIERYKALTRQAHARFQDLKLAVWPETAMPFYFQQDGSLRQQVLDLARELHIYILFGSPSFFYDPIGSPRYRNSAFLVGPDGSLKGRYDKQHLVPFGEYMPWGRLTSWARDMLPTAGDFCAGKSARPLEANPFKIGVMICFESIFPEISRKEVQAGGNLLSVITNDAWFGRTAAPFQHADMATFRAVETRRWIVRAANTGISRIISPAGRISVSSRLFEPCFITGMVNLEDRLTLFVRYGPYWFLALNLLFILINCLLNCSRFKKRGMNHGKDRARTGIH